MLLIHSIYCYGSQPCIKRSFVFSNYLLPGLSPFLILFRRLRVTPSPAVRTKSFSAAFRLYLLSHIVILLSILCVMFSCIFFKAFPGFSTILYRFPIHLTFSLQSGQEGFYLIGRFSYETKKGYCHDPISNRPFDNTPFSVIFPV